MMAGARGGGQVRRALGAGRTGPRIRAAGQLAAQTPPSTGMTAPVI